jgi:hypothetical protein
MEQAGAMAVSCGPGDGPSSGATTMKTTLIALIALGAFTAAAAADPTDRAATSGPMVLSAGQLDEVTAGIALLLPAVQQAANAVYLNWDAGLVLLDISDPADPGANPAPPGLPQLASPQ